MRLANLANRLTLVTANREIIDISKETGGIFGPRIQECYERWDELVEVDASIEGKSGKPLSQVRPSEFGSPGARKRLRGLGEMRHRVQARS